MVLEVRNKGRGRSKSRRERGEEKRGYIGRRENKDLGQNRK